jgi:hypothetical protein
MILSTFDGFFAPRATLMSKAVFVDRRFPGQWAFLTDNGQPFHNPVREGLPTIHPKQQQDQLKVKAPLGWL